MLPVHRCRGANPLGDLSVLLLVVTVVALGSSSPSWAQGGANGGVGKNDFGIDGNLLTNSPANGPNPGDPSTADDWLDGLVGPGVGVLNKNGTPKDPAHTRHGVDGTRLNADLTVFEGSNKIDDNPNTYEWKDGSVPQKDDIQNCLFHFSVEPNGSLWVNAAGDRLATNGDSYIDVELLQGTLTTVPDPIDPTHGDFVSSGPDGGRTVGDLLLTIELVRGGAQAEVFAMQWVAGGGPEGFHYEPIDLGNNAFVAANVESTVVVPYGAFGNTTYEINAFGEMSANLTELLGLECFGINTIFMRTKSSQSEDAELKDFFEPFTLEVCLDQVPPTITCAPVASPIECPATPVFPDPEVSDNCDTDVAVTFEDVTTPGDCAQEYTVTRTWTATDACGNTATCVQVVEVRDTTAPDINCPTAKSPIECPGVPSFPDPIVSDACDADPDVTFEDVTTPGDCPQEYLVTRTWTARDACGNSSTCSQAVEVQDTTAPDISCPTAKSPIECPGVPSFPDPIVSDACDPDPDVTFEDVTTPGKCPQEYIVTRTWTARDACGNASSCSQSVEVQDTTAPDISCPTAKSPIECPGVPSFPDPIVSDACDPDPDVTFEDVTTPGDCPQEYIVTRTWTARDACGNASSCSQSVEVQDTTAPDISCPTAKSPIECPGVPSFPDPIVSDACDPDPDVTFEDVTTPGKCPQEYIVTRTWTARDACGNASSCSQSVEVQDTTAPDISCPTAKSPIECPGVPSFPDPIVSDTCDPSPRVTFVDETTPGDCPLYTVTRTWTATDACGNSSSCSQSVEVRDTTAPDISCPTAKSPIECPGVPSFPDPIVSDACDPNPDVTFEDVTTPGDCPQEYIVTRTWTARDACGNSATCTQSVEVQDTTAPDITCADVKSPIECPGTPVFPPPDVTDACDADPDVTFEDKTTPGKCPQEYIVTRTWTARDACGNSATCTQSVEVQDTTDPTITCPLAIEVECGEEVPPPDTELVVCDDTCDDSPSTEFVSDVSNGAQCPDPEVITRTYRCTDACGNSAECTQTITVLCCPSDHFCTLTQGAYGTAGGTYNGQGTLSLIQSLLSGSDLVVGKPGRSITIPQAAAQCIINRLPAGGTAGSLPNIGDDTLAHPTCQTTPAIPLNNQGNFNNVLIGQTIALGLNLRLDPNLENFELAKQFCTKGALPGPDGLFCTDDDVIDPNSPVQSFTIPNAVITALSNLGLSNDVEGLLELANRALAAQATGGATATQINSAVDAINRGFDRGRFIVPCPLGIVASKPEDLELTIFGIPAAEAAPSVGPAHYELGQSNPNPFNPHTRITLSLPEATSWTLDIYNVSGQLVRRFEGQVDGAEYVPVVWDGTNRNGEPVAPGVYLYRMNAGGFSATKKMILLK